MVLEVCIKDNPSFQKIQKATKTCVAPADVPAVVHICKFMVVDRSIIRDLHWGDEITTSIMVLERVSICFLNTFDAANVLNCLWSRCFHYFE